MTGSVVRASFRSLNARSHSGFHSIFPLLFVECFVSSLKRGFLSSLLQTFGNSLPYREIGELVFVSLVLEKCQLPGCLIYWVLPHLLSNYTLGTSRALFRRSI